MCIYVNKVKANSQAARAVCELAFFCMLTAIVAVGADNRLLI
ncbi:hypothetical protein PPOLYM_04165 [Paenibacillus polymyxa]|jgi:hypothetical protein|uniref:Uncharacterized protein n=1 Tax=Paenibacillus peoriae TaxID=59893 RepID=A0ABU1QJB5_9BACL|nr:hypothetical protein [Paenibacillus peoriae]SFR21912.1 hypothetical protein SAMN04488603_106218 [Paenibacillus sp. cl130]VUG07743.1 hypothetical protein PPOLYM_04165 [Paenibacillus polymyxa]